MYHGPATERHYTVPEIAELWQISTDTVRRLLDGQPGVLRIVRPESPRKRPYTTYRVAESVLALLHARLTA